MHKRNAAHDAGVVEQVARREVVGPVDDDVPPGEQLHRVRARQRRPVRDDLDVGVEGLHGATDRVHLRLADSRRRVDDLALQVGDVHDVVVDDPETSHPRSRQVEGRGGTECARSHEQDASRTDALLPGHAHLGDEHIAAVAAPLRSGQWSQALRLDH